jgi:hypothetical protein
VFQKNIPGPRAVGGRRESHETFALPDYVLDPEKRLVSVTFRKKVTVKDIEKYAASLGANPLFEPDFSEIVDLSEVEELDLQADEFIRLADEIDPFSVRARRAFVVRNPVQDHAARMHKILRTQRSFSIFRSVEEAEQWIGAGLPPD